MNASNRSVKPGEPPAAGDVEGKGACLTCHRVNGRGLVAPDLSDIGAIRSAGGAASARCSIRAAMMPINRPVRAVTKDGKTVKGRRLNEDTFTVQMMDDQGGCVSLMKADLREYRSSTTSPMPSYKASSPARRLADVMAYLLSLKGSMTHDTTNAARARRRWPGLRCHLRLDAQVTYERLLRAADEPQNWLTYGGDYFSQRHSLLTRSRRPTSRISSSKWMYQAPVDRQLAGDAARRRRHHVHHAAAERRDRARCQDRPRVLGLSIHTVARPQRLLRHRTIAAWRFSATRCSWARSTRS